MLSVHIVRAVLLTPNAMIILTGQRQISYAMQGILALFTCIRPEPKGEKQNK